MLLRVLTWNIHKCIGGLDRQYRPDRVVSAIGEHAPDVAFLQEVDNRAERSNWDRQVDMLGNRLGLEHRAYFANVHLKDGGEYGNAILSRFPLDGARNIDLTVPPKKRRGAIHARLIVPEEGGEVVVHLVNLHLGLLGLERKWQLRRLLHSEPLRRLSADTPVIMAGDLNDAYGTLGPKILLPAGFTTRRHRATFPAFAPIRALDAVYVRGDLQIEGLDASDSPVAMRASDHLPLLAELSLGANGSVEST